MALFGSFRWRLSIGLVLTLSLGLAVAIPVVLVRTLVRDSAHQAVESEVVRLSLGILDSARLSLDEYLGELAQDFEAAGPTADGRFRLPSRQDPLGPAYLIRPQGAQSQAFALVQQPEEKGAQAAHPGPLFTLEPVPWEFHPDAQTLEVLAENPTRRLWVGKLPFLPKAPDSLWLVGRAPGTTDLLALSMPPEALAALLDHLSESVASTVYLVTADNTVLPPGKPAFFGQPWAAKALSRSKEGVFFTFAGYDIREAQTREVLVHVYADPRYLFNLVAVTPRSTLTSSVDAVINQTTVLTTLVAVLLGLFCLAVVFAFSRQLRRLTGRLSTLAEGQYHLPPDRRGSFLLETAQIATGIAALAARLEENQKTIEESRLGLEERVAERTLSLTRTLDELTRAQATLIQTEKMAALGRTVAAFTHEINNPLGASLTAVGLLVDGVAGLQTALAEKTMTSQSLEQGLQTLGEAADLIQRSLQRAITVTGSVKTVAADQSHAEVRDYDLADYLREVLAALQPMIRHGAHTLDLKADPGITLRGDPAVLYQIFSNLVLNSVKHGFEGRPTGRMGIGARVEGREVVLDYQDDGVGMSAEQLSRMYEPFFTTKRGTGGTGLGMSIVYNLVRDELKGTIHCESGPNEGVHFTIRFPIHEEVL